MHEMEPPVVSASGGLTVGYASYKENIQDKYDDLNHRVIEPSRQAIAEIRRNAAAASLTSELDRLETILAQLEIFRNDLLDLATDPEVQTAWELFDRRVENARLAARVQTLEPTIAVLRDRLAAKDTELARLKSQLEQAKKDERRAERQAKKQSDFIDRRAQKNPAELARLLDEYPPRNNPTR